MERKTSTSRQKWREGFQKSRTQKSVDFSRRKSSLLEDETSDQELQQYLESLKQKSGVKRLWGSSSFDKSIRNEEDKTPDISISSSDNDLGDLDPQSATEKDDDSDSDFKPNLVMFPDSPPKEDNIDNDDTHGSLFQGVQIADFHITDNEDDKNTLNNDTPTKSITISEPKDVRNVLNNLNLVSDAETEDDAIAEEIDDEIDEVLPSFNRSKTPDRANVISPVYSSPSQTPVGHRSQNRPQSQSKSVTSVDHSYTMDFSTADDHSIIEEKSEPSYRSSTRASSSRRSKSSRSSRSKSRRSSKSRSGYSSSSSNTSIDSRSFTEDSHRSRVIRKNKESSNTNIHLSDACVQTGLDLELPPAGLAVGMATVNQRLGMQYVDPSPIATHAVSAEALEAVTAYNPAVVALTDMLKQQIQLVEQFVDTNNRMYQAYTSNLNTQYRYTTLEETLEFIKANRPKPLSMKDAMKKVKEEDF